jgi:aromatic-L-amino-acid decarboxylase
MDHDELAVWSKRAADWARDYHAALRDRPVRPDLKPGDFRQLIEAPAPEAPDADRRRCSPISPASCPMP